MGSKDVWQWWVKKLVVCVCVCGRGVKINSYELTILRAHELKLGQIMAAEVKILYIFVKFLSQDLNFIIFAQRGSLRTESFCIKDLKNGRRGVKRRS